MPRFAIAKLSPEREGGECREIEIYCKGGEREERARVARDRQPANEEVLGGGGVSGNLGVARRG